MLSPFRGGLAESGIPPMSRRFGGSHIHNGVGLLRFQIGSIHIQAFVQNPHDSA